MYLIANNFTDFINSLCGFELQEDEDGKNLLVYTHDKYSLPFSNEVKKYGPTVTDFFAKAPEEVEDYIIEETESTKDLLLRYEVKSTGNKYYRKISANGKIEDYQI